MAFNQADRNPEEIVNFFGMESHQPRLVDTEFVYSEEI
jgi:hypothetical protein